MARSRLLLVAAATIFAILVLAAPTLAEDGQPTQEVYAGEAGNVQAQIEQGAQDVQGVEEVQGAQEEQGVEDVQGVQDVQGVEDVQGAQGEEAVPTSSGGESLPLTGLNLALIIIVGAVLVGSGLMLRRRGKAPE